MTPRRNMFQEVIDPETAQMLWDNSFPPGSNYEFHGLPRLETLCDQCQLECLTRDALATHRMFCYDYASLHASPPESHHPPSTNASGSIQNSQAASSSNAEPVSPQVAVQNRRRQALRARNYPLPIVHFPRAIHTPGQTQCSDCLQFFASVRGFAEHPCNRSAQIEAWTPPRGITGDWRTPTGWPTRVCMFCGLYAADRRTRRLHQCPDRARLAAAEAAEEAARLNRLAMRSAEAANVNRRREIQDSLRMPPPPRPNPGHPSSGGL